MGRDRIQTVGCCYKAHDEDSQRHIAVHRLALQLGALAALGGAQFLRQFGLCLKILLCLVQNRNAVAGVIGQLFFRQFAGSLFRRLLFQRLLSGFAQGADLRLLFGQHFQDLVHILLILEIALLLLAAVVLHHKVGHGGEHSFAGKAAGAHGHPLVHAGNAAVGQIVTAVDVKAVQVQRLFADTAGADFPAGLFVLLKLLFVQFRHTQLCRFKDHGSSLLYSYFSASIFAPEAPKCNPFGR